MPEARFITRFVVFSRGERFPMLLEEAGRPHRFSTLYLTIRKRNANKAPNTMLAVLGAAS